MLRFGYKSSVRMEKETEIYIYNMGAWPCC